MKQITLLQELLMFSAKFFPHKVALIIDKDSYTYAEIFKQSLCFAENLKQNGLKRGGRVIVNAGNTLQTITAFWGTLIADGVISVITPGLSEDKLNYILEDSDAQVWVTEKTIKLLSDRYPQEYFFQPGISKQFQERIGFSQAKISTDIAELAFQNHELDIASIIYTSGSTGEPKGVMMTHRNMLAAAFSINEYLKHYDQDVILCALPMSFDYGLYQMIMAFSVGATLVLEQDALFSARLLRKIEVEKVTVLPGVPALFSLLAEHANYFQYNYSTLRAVTNTGAALTDAHFAQISNLFPHAEIFSMYGLTECKRCTYLPPQAIHRKRGSVGIAIPNTELWIVDERGQKVAPNVVGQLVVRGATVMKGYWNKPEESAKKLKNGPVPGEKVLFTGDYAMLDEEGYLYFKGRIDEIIKFKGMKVSPLEIELTLCKLPEIRDVAAFSLLSPEQDSQLIVCVGVRDKTEEMKLRTLINNTLPRTHKPTHIFIWETLPKNVNGKIDLKILKDRVAPLLLAAG